MSCIVPELVPDTTIHLNSMKFIIISMINKKIISISLDTNKVNEFEKIREKTGVPLSHQINKIIEESKK